MLFNNSKENTDILLERLREDIYEKGFRAIEKKHVKLIMDSEEPDFMASLVINGWEEPRRHYANPILSERQFNKLLKFPTCKQFVPKALKTRGKKKECPKVFVSL